MTALAYTRRTSGASGFYERVYDDVTSLKYEHFIYNACCFMLVPNASNILNVEF